MPKFICLRCTCPLCVCVESCVCVECEWMVGNVLKYVYVEVFRQNWLGYLYTNFLKICDGGSQY